MGPVLVLCALEFDHCESPLVAATTAATTNTIAAVTAAAAIAAAATATSATISVCVEYD